MKGGRGFNYNILQIAKGPFRHPAILNTFAYYLEAIDSLPHKHLTKDKPCGALALSTVAVSPCHDRDIPPQPSHTYSFLLAVQTPPEHSLTKPEPIPGLPDPSTAFPNPSAAFPNPSAAFPKGCCTDVCLVSVPEAVNTIPEHI